MHRRSRGSTKHSPFPALIAQALATATDHASVTNRLELASRLAEEALEYADATGDPWEVASALRARARGAITTAELRERVDLAAADGDVLRAARLKGAAQSHTFDHQQDDIVRRVEAAFLHAARASAGADAWDRSVLAGAAMGFEDAIAYALEDRPRP